MSVGKRKAMTPKDISLGVQAFKDNIQRLLDEALVCLDLLGPRSHALGIYMFAVEECDNPVDERVHPRILR